MRGRAGSTTGLDTETAVEFNEVLIEVRIPILPLSSSAYEKVERRVGDWAVAAAGAAVTFDTAGTLIDVGIGVTAVGLVGRAADAEAVLRGQKPSEDLIAEGRFPILPGRQCKWCDAAPVCRKTDSISAYRTEPASTEIRKLHGKKTGGAS